jgi:hypothetical protein
VLFRRVSFKTSKKPAGFGLPSIASRHPDRPTRPMDLSREERWLGAIEEQGLWPFVSRRIYRHYNGSHHCLAVPPPPEGAERFRTLELLPIHVLIRLGLWMPKDLNWWIGVIFAFGSALLAKISWKSFLGGPPAARLLHLVLREYPLCTAICAPSATKTRPSPRQ